MSIQTVELKESEVLAQSAFGGELRGRLLKVARHAAVFEVHNSSLAPHASEVLDKFRLTLQGRSAYLGRAVVSSVVNTGLGVVYEVSLDESSWDDVGFTAEMLHNGELAASFEGFVREWGKSHLVSKEYKLLIAEMESFLRDLQQWLDQVELGIRSCPEGDRVKLERAVATEVCRPIIPAVSAFFERFERLAAEIPANVLPAHRSYMRRQLHRWFLAAPFAHRAYQKPLGYAGDYELVNMMARNEIEGGSLFAKVVNAWFLAQAPAEAHRKRLDYLLKTLKLETLRVVSSGQRARIFNVACGPAIEIQRFLAQEHLSSETSISLLDFDQETLDYARAAIERARGGNNRAASLHFIRKSVQTLLKESGRTTIRSPADQYDLVYCAGLFDYLSDAVCQRLLGLMYEWLAPGGLLVATNVEPSNPLRHGMEHLLDWHLVYRTAPELLALKPPPAPDHAARVWADDATLVNIWLEVRKPKNG